jgi:hypothetical protein
MRWGCRSCSIAWSCRGRLVGATDDVLDQLFARIVPTTDAAGAGPRREQMPLTLDVRRSG